MLFIVRLSQFFRLLITFNLELFSTRYICRMRYLLLPFSLIYATVIFVRNFFYDAGIFSSTSFDFPVIVVGNLRVGGTGKTPMVEYLVRRLNDRRKLAVLSRGYGRKTRNFILADTDSSAKTIGDEPRQIKQKFPDISVAVDRDRVSGIKQLRASMPDLDAVLLDDAFQHRKVRAGLNIMLTAYNRFYCDDFILPVGRLRETASSAKRAHIIVVTKCPVVMGKTEQRALTERISPKEHQHVCYAYEHYGKLKSVFGQEQFDQKSLRGKRIVLVTGIANADRLKEFLERYNEVVEHLDYGDHHWYKETDIDNIISAAEKHSSSDTLVITTEKDVQRFVAFSSNQAFHSIPIFYIPIEICFHEGSGQTFDQLLNEYVNSYPAN